MDESPSPQSSGQPFAQSVQGAAPILVTATIGAADFAWADGLRRRYYPPERNQVPAHITLFHHLPPSVDRELRQLLAALAREKPPAASIDGVVALSGGAAILVRSPGLLVLRDRIAERFAGLLVPQDRAPPRLHITVQNKAQPEVARATVAALQDQIRPRSLAIHGLACWHYRGGPWSPISTHAFRGVSR